MIESPGQDQHWSDQDAAGRVRWLRAGGQLGEWADNTISDVEFASQTLHLDEGDTLVNLTCGWGRHAIALAHFGLNVIGIDRSADLLGLARDTSDHMGVAIRWVHGDLEDVLLREPVDAVVQFRSNLLDWVDGPADALHILDQVHAILKPGGRFLFGSPDWRALPPSHEQSWSETSEGKELYHCYFDSDSRTRWAQTVITQRDGSRREYWRHGWHPTTEQMAALLFQAEFVIEAQLNDFGYLPYDPDRPGLVWLAQKA